MTVAPADPLAGNPVEVQYARDSLCVAYEFEPKKVYGDAASLLKAAEGKTEDEILALPELEALKASDTQVSIDYSFFCLSLFFYSE